MDKRKKSKAKNMLLEHIKTNSKEYYIALILFLIGVTVGVLFINNTSQSQGEIISEYLNTFVSEIKTEEFNINKLDLLKQSIINNIGLVITLWFVGSTVIGIPIVCGIVVFRGFSFGYTIASVIATFGAGKGILLAFITTGIKNILFIPCLLALAVSGFKLTKSILKDKRKENIKFEIYRHTFFSLLAGIIIIFSSMLESYVATAFLDWAIKFI